MTIPPVDHEKEQRVAQEMEAQRQRHDEAIKLKDRTIDRMQRVIEDYRAGDAALRRR